MKSYKPIWLNDHYSVAQIKWRNAGNFDRAIKESDEKEYFYVFYIYRNNNECIKYIGKTFFQMAHERVMQQKRKVVKIKKGEKVNRVMVKYGKLSLKNGSKITERIVSDLEKILIMANWGKRMINWQNTVQFRIRPLKRYLIKNSGNHGDLFNEIGYGLFTAK